MTGVHSLEMLPLDHLFLSWTFVSSTMRWCLHMALKVIEVLGYEKNGWLFLATKLVNPFFALLDAEVAHKLAVSVAACGWVPREKRPNPLILRLEVWERQFSNPLGLVAGFDKNAEAVKGLLGWILVFRGLFLTLAPQEGNDCTSDSK